MLFFAADSAFRRALSTVARNGHLVSDWTTLCRYLGLDELTIETISYRYSGVRERCYHSLMTWTHIADKTGKRLTVNSLIQVLRRCNSHKLAGTKIWPIIRLLASLHKDVFTLWYMYAHTMYDVRRTAVSHSVNTTLLFAYLRLRNTFTYLLTA